MALRMKDVTDEEVLLSLLQNPSKLDAFEKRVFEEWLAVTERGGALSDKQQTMARRKFQVLGLLEKFDRDNLASATKVTGAFVNVSSTDAYESMLGPKPLTPPRRSAR